MSGQLMPPQLPLPIKRSISMLLILFLVFFKFVLDSVSKARFDCMQREKVREGERETAIERGS